MRHNKQRPTSFDYFRVEGKNSSDVPCGSGRCLLSVLAEIRLNECEIKITDTLAGTFCSMYGITWWSLVIFAFQGNIVSLKCLAISPPPFLFYNPQIVYENAFLSLGENERKRKHNQ